MFISLNVLQNFDFVIYFSGIMGERPVEPTGLTSFTLLFVKGCILYLLICIQKTYSCALNVNVTFLHRVNLASVLVGLAPIMRRIKLEPEADDDDDYRDCFCSKACRTMSKERQFAAALLDLIQSWSF